MERYELIEGSASKFWEVSVDDAKLTVRYGRIGTQGQTKDKDFVSSDAATKEKNKLVKEKTSKGYTLVSSSGGAIPSKAPQPATKQSEEVVSAEEAATAPAAASAAAKIEESTSTATQTAGKVEKPAEPTSPSQSPSDELESYLARALPTRTRPQGELDGPAAWRALRELLLPMMEQAEEKQKDAVNWLREHLSETGPESISPDEAGVLIGHIESVANELLPNRWRVKGPQRDAKRNCTTYLMHWVVTKASPEAVVELATGTQAIEGDRDWRVAWNSAAALALRSALVKTPETYYEQVIALSAKACAEKAGSKLAAYFAFILADDRPKQHDLQPLATLDAAEAAGEKIPGRMLSFTSLLVDSPPSGAARWRTEQDDVPYLGYLEIGVADIGATGVAVARHHREPALPVLSWLMNYVHEGAKTDLARLILAVDEGGSLPALLPQLHDKWIRPALDGAAKDNPARTFRQCLNVVASGSSNLQLKARVMEVIKSKPAETLRQWAGSDAKALSYLERALVSNDSLAERESWPDVLRDPPWRKKAKAGEDIVLALAPIATPFVYTQNQERQDDPYWRKDDARIVQSMAELPAIIAECEGKPKYDYYRIPAPSVQPPKPGDNEDQVLKWLDQRLMEIMREKGSIRFTNYQSFFDAIERQPDALALLLWQSPGVLSASYFWQYFFPEMMARFGERALPGFIRQLEVDPILVLEGARCVDAGEIAPHAARALFKLKKARTPAMAWLRKYRRTAILRLIPDAVGAKGGSRDAAEHALRWLATNTDGGRAEIESLAKDYARTEPRITEALAQVLDRDPLSRYPAKIAKLPSWFVPSALSRPELMSGGALPDEAMTALAEMLSFTTPDAIYAGIDIVKQQTTKPSLAAFAWDLFSAWLASGAPSKDGWAMRAVGWLGDDECARQLTRLIRKWPGEASHARAVSGLDVLVDIGSDIALMNLNGIAEKLKFKGLQEKAREKIAALAEARDLTPEELSDRLAPDLDLDERGGLDLNFGERRFRVGFDEFLKPWVKDSTGQRLKDLPKPNRSDDPESSAAAVERWKALKKDARSIASLQITRLETMLSTSRRTKPDTFWTFFAIHPLIRHLAQRLVWGVYADDNPRTAPTTIFRITDDLSVTDASDEPLELDVSETAPGRIGLVHPLHLSADGLDAWGALFGDYEIAQPFPQLGREIYELTDGEKTSPEIFRFDGIKVEAARMRGVGSRGWRLGNAYNNGTINWIERDVRMDDGAIETVILDFADGYLAAGAPDADETPTLGKLTLYGPYQDASSTTRTFGQLDPVTVSEMLRGPSLLVASERK